MDKPLLWSPGTGTQTYLALVNVWITTGQRLARLSTSQPPPVSIVVPGGWDRGWPKLEISGDTSPCFDSMQCVTYLYVLGCTWSQLGWGRSRRLEGLDASGLNIFVLESLCYWYWWVTGVLTKHLAPLTS